METSARFGSTSSRSGRRHHVARAIAGALGLAACALVAIGCETDGLSVRDPQGRAYPQVVNALADPSLLASTSADATAPAVRPAPPLRVAVAQLGEVAPPQSVIEVLRKSPDLFAAAEPITAPAFDPQLGWSNSTNPDAVLAQREAVRHSIVQMRNVARDIGCDYVFAFGGNCDHSTNSTSLSLADLTIVGAFIVPTKDIRAEGKAAGSLIDVRTGRVVMTVSTSAKDSRLTPSVARENDELKLLADLRDKLVKDLAEQLRDRVSRGAFGPAGNPAPPAHAALPEPPAPAPSPIAARMN